MLNLSSNVELEVAFLIKYWERNDFFFSKKNIVTSFI